MFEVKRHLFVAHTSCATDLNQAGSGPFWSDSYIDPNIVGSKLWWIRNFSTFDELLRYLVEILKHKLCINFNGKYEVHDNVINRKILLV
jgi:hypothetical protein